MGGTHPTDARACCSLTGPLRRKPVGKPRAGVLLPFWGRNDLPSSSLAAVRRCRKTRMLEAGWGHRKRSPILVLRQAGTPPTWGPSLTPLRSRKQCGPPPPSGLLARVQGSSGTGGGGGERGVPVLGAWLRPFSWRMRSSFCSPEGWNNAPTLPRRTQNTPNSSWWGRAWEPGRRDTAGGQGAWPGD